jgi:exopolysaccharide biosynthesis polyprenyl glycosylphosphotransferase
MVEMSVPQADKKVRTLGLRAAELRPILILGDLVVGVVALMGALFMWGVSSDEWLGFSREFLTERVPLWFYLLPLVWLMLMVELYDLRAAANWRRTLRGVAVAAAAGLGLYLLVYFSSQPRSLPRSSVAYFLLSVSLLTIGWRSIYIRIFTASAVMRRVLIVGAGSAGTTLLKKLAEISPLPFIVCGVMDDDPAKHGQEVAGFKILGGAVSLPTAIQKYQVSELILSISGPIQGSTYKALLQAQEIGVEISRMQQIYEELFNRVPIFHLESEWMIRSFVDGKRVSMFYLFIKRLVDILGGLVGSLLMLVLLPFVTLANLLETGRPIFYLQTRAGMNDRPYQVIKFRTMNQDAEVDGVPRWTREGDERVTRVGWFLRKTHLDELPQFFNVLRGDMSLVGPRPERPELISLFQEHVPFYRARLLVKPGLSGWAQIHQTYAANVEETNEKLEYDLYYIKNRNLWLDFWVLIRTPATVLGLRGR